MYTVQVLLSTYNGETYLKQQLDSILNQKNVAVKLFVRDDGSSDGTVDILRAYAALHDNICYLCGENCGVVACFFIDLDQNRRHLLVHIWDADAMPVSLASCLSHCSVFSPFPIEWVSPLMFTILFIDEIVKRIV